MITHRFLIFLSNWPIIFFVFFEKDDLPNYCRVVPIRLSGGRRHICASPQPVRSHIVWRMFLASWMKSMSTSLLLTTLFMLFYLSSALVAVVGRGRLGAGQPGWREAGPVVLDARSARHTQLCGGSSASRAGTSTSAEAPAAAVMVIMGVVDRIAWPETVHSKVNSSMAPITCLEKHPSSLILVYLSPCVAFYCTIQ